MASKEGVHRAGGYPMEFGTISVSDGISMGHVGMHYSLVSREIIADSVETVVQAERLDGTVLLAGCDKSLPGMLMAAARLDLAAVFVYAGSIMPGYVGDREVNIADAFEAVGRVRARADHRARRSTPSSGPSVPARAPAAACTPRTRWPAPPRRSAWRCPARPSPPAVDRRRDGIARASGEAVVGMIEKGITARQILTREAFENAIAVVMAFGGSTNAVLHLLAIAREAEVPLDLDDFNRVGDRIPHLADVKPFGGARHVHGGPGRRRAGGDEGAAGRRAAARRRLTVTGATVAENLAAIDPPGLDGAILRRLDDPIHPTGGITILRGSLAPGGRRGQERRVRLRAVRRHAPGCSTASRARWPPSRTARCRPATSS